MSFVADPIRPALTDGYPRSEIRDAGTGEHRVGRGPLDETAHLACRVHGGVLPRGRRRRDVDGMRLGIGAPALRIRALLEPFQPGRSDALQVRLAWVAGSSTHLLRPSVQVAARGVSSPPTRKVCPPRSRGKGVPERKARRDAPRKASPPPRAPDARDPHPVTETLQRTARRFRPWR